MTQTDAQYQSHPKDGRQCSGCTMFQPPAGCTLVEGRISPAGYCIHWKRKR